jgi:hypothetical protein
VAGGAVSIFVLVWFAGHGHAERDAEDAAREYYDAHGRWPDDAA